MIFYINIYSQFINSVIQKLSCFVSKVLKRIKGSFGHMKMLKIFLPFWIKWNVKNFQEESSTGCSRVLCQFIQNSHGEGGVADRVHTV